MSRVLEDLGLIRTFNFNVVTLIKNVNVEIEESAPLIPPLVDAISPVIQRSKTAYYTRLENTPRATLSLNGSRWNFVITFFS